MLKSKQSNSKAIIIFVLLLVVIIIGSMLINSLFSKNSEPNEKDTTAQDYSSIYCKTEMSPTDKIEHYYDFYDGSVYRYTLITTVPINKDFNKEKKEKLIDAIEKMNTKYKGAISKIWFEEEAYTLTEIYDLNSLTEAEMKNIMGMSIKELKKQSREELKKSIVPMSGTSFYCK